MFEKLKFLNSKIPKFENSQILKIEYPKFVIRPFQNAETVEF